MVQAGNTILVIATLPIGRDTVAIYCSFPNPLLIKVKAIFFNCIIVPIKRDLHDWDSVLFEIYQL